MELGTVTVLPRARRYKDGEKTGYWPGRVFANHAPDKGEAVQFTQIIERVRTVQPNKTSSPARQDTIGITSEICMRTIYLTNIISMFMSVTTI